VHWYAALRLCIPRLHKVHPTAEDKRQGRACHESASFYEVSIHQREAGGEIQAAKFGASFRSKTTIAQTNELLCKALCHNICCVIQSMYELGIEAHFA
jgi:hypothetical protein